MNVRGFRGFISAISALIAVGVGMLVGTLTAAIMVILLWGHLYVR
jgi:hypothetical protein